MPLNTQPLSLTRRIIAIVVLLGILAGSLGLAKSVGAWRKARHKADVQKHLSDVYNDGVKVVLSPPASFVVKSTDEGGNPDIWAVQRPSGQAIMIRIDGRTRGYSWDQQAELIEVELNRRSATPVFVEQHQPMSLGGVDAMGFIGQRPRERAIHAYACSTIIRGHLIQLAIYSEEEPLDANLVRTFQEICAAAQVSVDGMAVGAASRPATGRGTL